MSFRLILNFILAVVFSMACSHQQKSTDTFKLKITVQHLPNKDAWRVTYNTTHPITELIFSRRTNLFRMKNWNPLAPGISIIQSDKREIIKGTKPFQEVSFELNSYYEITPKDYEFFQKFSDDSVVMYTGHFDAYSKIYDTNTPIEFIFIPRTDETGIVAGNKFTSLTSWIDFKERGTYVYFGNLKPIETKDFTAIIDPTLPSWLLTRFNKYLPEIFSFYVAKTGYSIPFKPFIFLNYSSLGSGYSSHGGTLPGLIQMSLSGKAWGKEDVDSFAQVIRFFAHESAHVWNGQIFPYEDEDMWMHEGGADAFAFLAMHELNVLEKSRLKYHKNKAFNECLSKLKNRPLREVKEDPEYKAFYKCGSIFHLMAGAAINRQDPNAGVFQFWKSLFDEAKKSGKPYTEDLYFFVLDKLSGNSLTSNAIKQLLDGPVTNAEEQFQKEFERLDLEISVTAPLK